MHHILLTGVSGYLGGDLLDSLTTGDGGPLPPHKLYALVRSDAQADAVRQRGAEPLRFDPYKADEAHEAVVANGITVVCFLIDALRSEAQVNLIKALAESSKATGLGAHFIHVCPPSLDQMV